ncbi:hypothetical protein QBC46DRAFT_422039 [Diplogelasinospora grovesii]|uniref:Uncharacterized protein n=1 Tax=Diplogelasinospora grovesii TaxID=303347 RepID=A0AAN6MZT7_9PEZI|nr:hypothetical protein QBC46DRAFT_422039 [Diplogelasinospora grovesii]
MTPSPPSDAFLSIRASCDRCRSRRSATEQDQKPNGSRRRPMTASISVSIADGRTAPTVSAPNPVSNPSDAQNCPDSVAEEAQATTPKTQMTARDEAFAFYDSWNQASTQNEMALLQAPGAGGADNTFLEYTFQENTTIHDRQLFTSDISLVSEGDGELNFLNYGVVTSSASESQSTSGLGCTPTKTDPATSDSSAATRLLLNLASDLHERREALENGPWQLEKARPALDGYPIGIVLCLSQELTNVANALRGSQYIDECSASNRRVQPNDQGNCISAEDPTTLRDISAATTCSPSLDISVTLILLSCYVTLTRISTTVLGHFENYLHCHPTGVVMVLPLTVYPTSAACLSDLPLTNAPYNRIHTAMCMLLNSLEQAEEALGLPFTMRSAAGLSGLQSGGCISETETEAEALSDDADGHMASGVIRWEMVARTNDMKSVMADLRSKVIQVKARVREQMGL